MKVDDLIRRLRELGKSLEARKLEILTIAGQEQLAMMLERIFEKGLGSNGNKIGNYSTDAIYVKSPFPQVTNSRLNKIGKTGKSTKSTTYLKGGYKEFRDRTGRQTQTVDLNLTGSLFKSVTLGRYKDGVVIFFNQKGSIAKAKGNEDRFGKDIFSPTKEEKQQAIESITREVNNLVKTILQ